MKTSKTASKTVETVESAIIKAIRYGSAPVAFVRSEPVPDALIPGTIKLTYTVAGVERVTYVIPQKSFFPGFTCYVARSFPSPHHGTELCSCRLSV